MFAEAFAKIGVNDYLQRAIENPAVMVESVYYVKKVVMATFNCWMKKEKITSTSSVDTRHLKVKDTE